MIFLECINNVVVRRRAYVLMHSHKILDSHSCILVGVLDVEHDQYQVYCRWFEEQIQRFVSVVLLTDKSLVQIPNNGNVCHRRQRSDDKLDLKALHQVASRPCITIASFLLLCATTSVLLKRRGGVVFPKSIEELV